ncbi:MAG: D-alanyl-D-alanine carboxypeptidase/D-alanyl-D-alanine-endopeptidase [Acidimicrobiia bacterium]
MRARLPVAALAAALAVGSGAVAVAPELRSAPATTPATAEPSTPVFSLRRAPALLTRHVAAGRLRAELDAVLEQPSLGSARDDTCLAVSDPDGRPLYGRQVDASLIPASAMKIVTGAVTLARLGPGSRYVTPVRATGPPEDGAVGDLWFVGSGDPLLATADFAATDGWLERPRPATPIETLADRVVEAGVRRVGRLLGDESRYDTQRYIPTWEPHYATTPEVGPQSALNVNDGFASWRPRVAAASPATNAAGILAGLLRARGVTVGTVGEGRAPERTVPVAEIESAPMAEVVGVMMRESDNLGAELMVKELGLRFGGGGTTAAGLAVVRSTATELGLDAGPLAASDGSGLDRRDRLSCGLLQGLLARAPADGPLFDALPVAGTSGTLVRRFLNTPAVGKVRAKTGSLNGVVALAGFATGVDGRPFGFALVANDLPSEGAGTALQDRLATVLTTYPDAPGPEELAPGPVRPPPG